MTSVITSSDAASNPFAPQVLTAALGKASDRVLAPNTFEKVESVPLDKGNPDGGDHPNIVKAVFQGTQEGKHKNEVRYIVNLQSSNKAYAFKTEDEARGFVNYATATARKGAGATLGESADNALRKHNLHSVDLLAAGGYGGGIKAAFGKFDADVSPSVTINGDRKSVVELKEESFAPIAQFDFQEFSGTGLPSLPTEAAYYLQNTFKSIPSDTMEFGAQLGALSASAKSIYEHNGYARVENSPTVNVDTKMQQLIQTVFGTNTPNPGHLNTLRLMGLASAGDGGADKYAAWQVSDKGADILAGVEKLTSAGTPPVAFLSSLPLAAIESPKAFVKGGNLDLFISGKEGSFAFATKADSTAPYTFNDVQKKLEEQHENLSPELGDLPPEMVPGVLLESAAPEVKSLLESVFRTSNLDKSHVNTLISAGLLKLGNASAVPDSGIQELTLTPKGAWLQQQAATAPTTTENAAGDTGASAAFAAEAKANLGKLGAGGSLEKFRPLIDNGGQWSYKPSPKSTNDGVISKGEFEMIRDNNFTKDARDRHQGTRYVHGWGASAGTHSSGQAIDIDAPTSQSLRDTASWTASNWDQLNTLGNQMVTEGKIDSNPFGGDVLHWEHVQNMLDNL